MARELIQARCDDDTVSALEAYVDDTGISRSEAVRRTLRSGLAKEGYGVTASDGAGEFEELRAEIESVSSTQTRRHRIDLVQLYSLLAGLVYIIVTLALDLGGLVWVAVGIILIALMAGSTWVYSSDADE